MKRRVPCITSFSEQEYSESSARMYIREENLGEAPKVMY